MEQAEEEGSKTSGTATLKRSLTLPMLVLYGLGTTVGAGIYVLVGAAAGRAGMQAPLAFIVAAIAMIPTAASYGELSGRYPLSAGEAAYVEAGFKTRYMAIFIGGSIAVHAMAEKPFGVIVFFGFVFVWGLLSAPLVLGVAGAAPHVLTQAALTATLVFTGLTAYVFWSGKDFSFLGGILSIALWTMLGILLAGWLFGFGIGLWFSVLGVVVFSGYILYDTSNILQRYPTNAHVSAALNLFTDITFLFWYLLQILWSLSED